MTATTTATLTMTMTELTLADSLMPMMSRIVTSTAMSIAGRLMIPVTCGRLAGLMPWLVSCAARFVARICQWPGAVSTRSAP